MFETKLSATIYVDCHVESNAFGTTAKNHTAEPERQPSAQLAECLACTGLAVWGVMKAEQFPHAHA